MYFCKGAHISKYISVRWIGRTVLNILEWMPMGGGQEDWEWWVKGKNIKIKYFFLKRKRVIPWIDDDIP